MGITTAVVLVLEWFDEECFRKLDNNLVVVYLIDGLIHPSVLGLLVHRSHINSRMFASRRKATLELDFTIVLRL